MKSARKPSLAAMAAHAEEASRLLRALANPHRLMVLCALSDGEQSVSALNDRVPLSQSALSQHLAVLREDGLVQTRREAQTIFYALPDGPAQELIRLMYDIYCCRAPARSRRKA